jgi:SpoVK/Ycf46/Vps4 family AAA+-type ATPase
LEAIVTDTTLVRILPVEDAVITMDPQNLEAVPLELPTNWKCVMTGESSHLPLSSETIAEAFINQDTETIQALTLRMSMLLSQIVDIGTTPDAFVLQQRYQSRQRVIRGALDSYLSSKGSTTHWPQPKNETPNRSAANEVPGYLREGALIVHSPNRGAGKTLLVRAIAQERLRCDAIHVVEPTVLLSQYGIHADAALESLLHSIVMSAACQQESICIILDHLDAMLPSLSSSRANAGDAAMPVLKAMASYLKSLTLGLKRKREFAFPTKNHLYNLGGKDGYVLSVNLCLIGVVTCDDNGGRNREFTLNLSTGLDALVAGRYRLPPLSAKCRLVAFTDAFERANLSLSDEATRRLPILAASATEARGRSFSDVASCLGKLSTQSGNVALDELVSAFSFLKRGDSSLSKVEFTKSDSNVLDVRDIFSTVGGNEEAKKAIVEALALNREVRRLLQSFGLSPPTGVLLYGPPGTGKTLLAKSISKLLTSSQNGSISSVGGSFITLQASEIVRAEVGNSEKMVVSAFKTARSNSPSVIFIDEFQALFTERSGSGSGKLTSTLLQCLDDVHRWRDSWDDKTQGDDSVASSRVVVMGATNTPWMIDKAFFRPGRFDRVVHVGLPDLEERVSILTVHLCRMRLASSDNAFVERICRSLADEAEGFSGADLAALCRAAAVRCLNEHGSSGIVKERHFHEALIDFKPSCSANLAEQLSTWRP